MVGVTLVAVAATAGIFGYLGYAVGRHSSDEDDLHTAEVLEDAADEAAETLAESRKESFNAGWREAEALADSMYAGDWDRGYNVGLEAGRAAADPATIAVTATAVREARLSWIQTQTKAHMGSYRDLFWRLLEVARDVGDRYRRVESLGHNGLIPIGDALNVCVYVADLAKQYEDNRILTRPHQGVFEGKAS